MARYVMCIAAAGALALGCGGSSNKNDDPAGGDAGATAARALDAGAQKRLEAVKIALVDNPAPRPPMPAVAERIRVKLSTKVTTWRQQGAFPIDMIVRSQLAERGVDVVDSGDVAGTVSINYKATKYKTFTVQDYYGGTTEKLHGSKIKIAVAVAPTDTSIKKASFSIEAQTDEYFYADYGADPHQNAVDRLSDNELYHQLGAVVAAVLGNTEARLELYEAQMAESGGYSYDYGLKPVTTLMKKLAFAPATDKEKAYAAALERDWKTCSSLGLACAPAIGAYLSNGGGYYTYDVTEQAGLISAIADIGAVGGEEAVRALLEVAALAATPTGPGYTLATVGPDVRQAWVSAMVATKHPYALLELTRLTSGYYHYELAGAARIGQQAMVAAMQSRPAAKGKVAVELKWSPALSKTPNLPAFIDNAIRRAELEPVGPTDPADGYFLVEYTEPNPEDAYSSGAITVVAVELRAGKIFGPLSSPVVLDGSQPNIAMLQQTAMANSMMSIADCAFAACRIPEAVDLFLNEDYNSAERVRALTERSGRSDYARPYYPDY